MQEANRKLPLTVPEEQGLLREIQSRWYEHVMYDLYDTVDAVWK